MNKNLKQSLIGSLIGTALGDSVGLPFEGLSFKTISKKKFDLDKQNFLFGYGMFSDDTEHSFMTAISIIKSKGDIKLFEKSLSKHLKLWLLCLPAGIGMATLRAILKLLIGFPVGKNGVYSAGNGTAMRAAVIGVCFGDKKDLLKQYIKSSSRITHTDKKAEIGAMSVAIASYLTSIKKNVNFNDFLENLKSVIEIDNDFLEILNNLKICLEKNMTLKEYADSIGLSKGVTGYMYHTIPIVLYCWLYHQNKNDFNSSIKDIISLGGDTDTTGAILGGILGSKGDLNSINKNWINNIIEPQLSIKKLEETGLILSECIENNFETKSKKIPNYFIINFIRNILFTIIVLLHGFKRILYIF